MKRVLVVDDEKTIRNGISFLVSRTGRYEVAGICSNGKEALEDTIKLKPDIVITDIRMPEMDGLSYISECSKLADVPKFIILSGFQEFDYLREAHLLDVVDYILKPVNHTDLIALLDRVSERIQLENEDRQLQLSQYGIVSIQQREKSGPHIQRLKEQLHIEMKNVRTIIISLKNSFTMENSLFNEAVAYIERELQGLENRPEITFLYEKQFIMIFNNCGNDPSRLLEHLRMFIIEMERRFSIQILVGAGERFGDDKGIKSSYEQALTAISGSMYGSDLKVYRCDPRWMIAEAHEKYFRKELGEITHYLDLCDTENGTAVIERFIEKIRIEQVSPEIVIAFCNGIYKILRDIFHDYSVVLSFEVLKEESMRRYILENHPDLAMLKQLLEKAIDEAVGFLKEIRSRKVGHVTEDIISYINNHLAEDLYLDRICEMFFINKSYLCRIFKKATGKTFNAYLTELRIRKAKLLLKHENLRINEIAMLVGYKNPRYFARTFLKLEHMTPSDYRASMIQ